MFSAARFVIPVGIHPQPRGLAAPGRHALALTAVSARPRRGGGGPRRDLRSWDDDGGGGSGDEADAIDESFFGDQDEDEPEEEENPPGRRQLASPEPALRGTDVLRALQRAAAAKEEAKKKKQQKQKSPAPRRREEKGGGGVKQLEVTGEVRPIEIRPDWAPRIRELELRVQQLLAKHH